MARRYYSSTAVETTLSGSISNSATSITVTALSGFPNTTPWTAILDEGTASEELVEVTNVAGTTLTVTRGVDGTAAVAHNAGASFKHGVSGRDFDEANSHVNASSGVHGRTGAVVGTTDSQTLTNKTITYTDNTLTGVAPSSNPTFTGAASFPQGSGSAPAITRTGDTDTGIHFPGENLIAIATGGSERVRINTNGLSVGGSATERIQVNSESSGGWRSVISGASAFTRFFFDRSRGTNASPTVVSDGDSVGDLVFRAHDGTTYVDLALVRVAVDGAAGASDMPGRIQFHTTVDGTSSLTERMRIDNAGLITGTGTSLGAWTAYTPTLTTGSTEPVLGTGSVAEGFYCQIGKVVRFRARLKFGTSGTGFGSGNYLVSLPVSARTVTYPQPQAHVMIRDVSTGKMYVGLALVNSATSLSLRIQSESTGTDFASSTSPFTWANEDEVFVIGTYEAA